MSGFKSNVTDYAEIQKRWREIGSTLPYPWEQETEWMTMWARYGAEIRAYQRRWVAK